MITNEFVKADFDKMEEKLTEDVDRLVNGRLVQPDYLGDRMAALKELNEKRQLLETLRWARAFSGLTPRNR